MAEPALLPPPLPTERRQCQALLTVAGFHDRPGDRCRERPLVGPDGLALCWTHRTAFSARSNPLLKLVGPE